MGSEKQTAIVQQQPKTLKEYIEVKRPEIVSMLPTHVNVERFLKSAMLAVARDKNLQECTPLSLFTSVVNAAELGLLFTPAKGHAYLVKYGNQAQLMVGYRGFIDLAKRTGDVSRIEAQIVYSNDKFTLEYGTDSKLIHVPKLDGNRGEILGAYAVAHFKDGDYQFEYADKADIDSIRKRSKAANSGPWVTDYNEMARKTVVRRLFKYLPSSSDLLDKAIDADNKAVGFADFEVEVMEDGDKTRKLAEKLTAKVEEPIEQADVIDEDTGEVVDPEPPKRGRPKKEVAGTFDPTLAKETLAELISGGKITKSSYNKVVESELDYPTIPPSNQLSQDEAVKVLAALGYAAEEE